MTSPRILRPSKGKTIAFLCVSAVFVAIGVKMASTGELMGWLGLVFFGLCGVVFVVNLLPGASFLAIDERGFTMRSLYREHAFKWSEVGPFRVQRVGVNAMVVFDFSGEYRRSPVLRRVSAAVAGCEGGLPDTYGLTPDALAQTMNVARAEALAAASMSPR